MNLLNFNLSMELSCSIFSISIYLFIFLKSISTLLDLAYYIISGYNYFNLNS